MDVNKLRFEHKGENAMMKNMKTACFVMAAAFTLNVALPVRASQLVAPGAGLNINNTGPGINSTGPGNTNPGTLPAQAPGNTIRGAIPGNTVPGTLPGNLPGNTVPGAIPGNTLPGAAAPGANYTNPGVLPGRTAPGTLPGPGMLPGNTAPGAQAVPGRQPGYAAPGVINPDSPYNNGTNLPGTSTIYPQVGGVTNDPYGSGQSWQNVPVKPNPGSVLDPITGRTRPLLRAAAVPGKIDVYNVHLHDTLWIIAQKYRIRVDAVIDANPELPDPDLIYPGDQIKVPLDPKSYETMDIADSNLDKGDGSTSIRSNIVDGRYSGITEPTHENTEEKGLLELVNNERAKSGLPALKLSAAVGTAARIKADEMSAKKYFNHTSPIYGTPFEMLHAFGISYRTAGENIAKGQKTANAVMGAWMNSEGHRANILNKDFTEIGIGYANDGQTTYWVLIFIGK